VSIDIALEFAKYDDERPEFELIESKFSNRPDLHAFFLLDALIPGTRDLVSAAEHDQIYFDVDIEVLAEVATEDHIRQLAACGIWFDEGVDSLTTFV
jgi:hypothetical protein